MPASLICQGQVPTDFQVAQVWMPCWSPARQVAAGLSLCGAAWVRTELITAAGVRAASLAKDLNDR